MSEVTRRRLAADMYPFNDGQWERPMTVRQVVCPKCGSSWHSVVTEHEPDTDDMNMRVTLHCDSPLCGHDWEARVTSNRAREQQKKGRIRL